MPDIGQRIASNVSDAELVSKRRAEISAAALTVFSSQGFHQATVRDVAREAGMAVGSIYDYVRKKEDLLDLVYDTVIEQAISDMESAIEGIEDAESRLRTLIDANLRIVERNQDFFLLMYQESASMSRGSLRNACNRENDYVYLYRRCLEDGVAQGVFSIQDAHATAVMISFLCSVWALKRWNLRGKTLDRVTEIITVYALAGSRGGPAVLG
jgi:TetR/AcrR family transcriptional regulator, cholesterol catabolism regulator